MKNEISGSGVEYKIIVGIDETGTGDYFGPVVTSSCAIISEGKRNRILNLFIVKDSKVLKDSYIIKIVPSIKKRVNSSTVVISNYTYNYLYKVVKNQNVIKTLSHILSISKNITKLRNKAIKIDRVVMDKFCSEKKLKDYIDLIVKNGVLNRFKGRSKLFLLPYKDYQLE